VSAKGPEHERTFLVELKLSGRALGRGEGKNKKEAEQMAARNALGKLGLVEGKGGARPKKKTGGRRGGKRRRRPRKRKKKEDA
jgi:hypothetical protein